MNAGDYVLLFPEYARVFARQQRLFSLVSYLSQQCSLITLILSCTVADGVQFGWAFQLSLLTPYIQIIDYGLEACRDYPHFPGSFVNLARVKKDPYKLTSTHTIELCSSPPRWIIDS
ncbi:hypothetical protein Q3G72_004527 [Acer saccharum]|nr:hypothetical protein Q3G72_021463 [Acer saccharum]KAK1558609.1 hypothetical protein Q3G72_004527 [Acer saccharum]